MAATELGPGCLDVRFDVLTATLALFASMMGSKIRPYHLDRGIAVMGGLRKKTFAVYANSAEVENEHRRPKSQGGFNSIGAEDL